MDESIESDTDKNKELPVIYKIFKEIYSKAPPILKDLSQDSIDIDFKEYIDDTIDFKKIQKKFQDEKYSSMTDAMKDIRLVFLNCYKFYGTKSDHTLKSLELEELLEQKISDLDEQYKSLADIQLTLNLLNLEKNSSYKFRYPKNYYDSTLLRCVAHCRDERLKEYHKLLSSKLTTDVDNAHTLEELVSWENEIYFNDHYQYISSMWELPEIGNFVAILFKELDLDIVNQGEIERMFLMPKESTTMSQIMTTLLTPIKKNKFNGQKMPYKVWSDKLSQKVSDWYKVYNAKNQNKVCVMNSQGIHPDFWVIVGDKNPLVNSDYCELSYFVKVWLVKGLCDHVTSKYKTINDIISNCNERQSTIWKNNMGTEEYFFFNSMPDFRIYYYNIPYDEPSLEFLELEKSDKELKEQDTLSISSIPSIFDQKSRAKPNEKQFKLIADSVQGLRSFLNELDIEDSSVPDDLISALENFMIKIEPEEYNLIILNNNSKIKLFKEWKSYPERLKNEEDEISSWKEKKLKSTSIVETEQIILEKRIRKSVIKPEYDFDIKHESDENFFESDYESLTDFTDSEDEWGAMNQSKSITKTPVQAQSKLAELENRLSKENTLSNNLHTNNTNKFDLKDNFLSFDKLKKNKDDKEKKLVDENEEERKVRRKSSTNTYVNGFCEKLVDLANVDDTSNEKVSIDEEVISIDIEKEESKSSLKYQKQKFVHKYDVCIDEEPKIKKVKNNNLKNNDIVVLDDDKLDGSEIIRNDSPVSIVSNSSVKEVKEISEHNNSTKNKHIDEEINVKKMKNNGLKNVDIMELDDDKLDSSEIIRNDSPVSIISSSSVEEVRETSEQNNSVKNKSIELNLNKNDEVISIDDDDDDDKIVISDDDDDDDVQFISSTPKPQVSSIKIGKPFTLNKSYNSVSRNKQFTTTNHTKRQTASTSIPKLSPNISIMPANVHVPKGIEVTMVKRPQTTIPTHYNATKRSTIRSNTHLTKKPSFVNVECKVVSKPNFNGEVKFYVSLPNGNLHPVSNELVNQYLNEHNNRLPDYWLVPLPLEVAKQYGFN